MVAKKKPTALIVKEVDYFSEGVLNTQKKIADIFSPEMVKVFMRVAHEISETGLSEKEAVLVSGYNYKKFQYLKEKFPVVQELIDLKDVEYKRDLLRNISRRAKQNDDKVAQWLLEARYPTEFNKRKGSQMGDDGGESMLAAAISFVRKTGDRNSLVSEDSGRAFIIKTKKNQSIINDINKMLD